MSWSHIREKTHVLALLLGFGFLLQGCLLSTRPHNFELAEAKATQHEQNEAIRAELIDFYGISSLFISQAQESVRTRTSSPRILRNLGLWQARVVPVIAFLTWNKNPKIAIIDSVTFAVAHRVAIENVNPGDFLEEHQPEALEAAKKIEEEAWKMAERTLPNDDYQRIRFEVQDWSEKKLGRFSRRNQALAAERFAYRQDFMDHLSHSGLLGGMESSLADTTEELSRLNRQVSQLTQIALDMPEVARWNVEAFVYDFIETAYMRDLMSKIDHANRDLDRMAVALEELPSKRFENIEAIRDETVLMIRNEVDQLLKKTFGMACVLLLMTFVLAVAFLWIQKKWNHDKSQESPTEPKPPHSPL